MDQNLKRIIAISIVNGVAIYFINKWLDEKKVLPQPTPQDNGK